MLSSAVYSAAESKTQLEARKGCQKFQCLANAFVFERQSFPQAWSVRETQFCLFLLDKVKAASSEVDILPYSEWGTAQKDILMKGELCFLIKCIFKVKHVTVKEREKNDTYIGC